MEVRMDGEKGGGKERKMDSSNLSSLTSIYSDCFLTEYSCCSFVHATTLGTSLILLCLPNKKIKLLAKKKVMFYKSLYLYLLLSRYHIQLFCNAKEYSPLGSSVPGILQARILE